MGEDKPGSILGQVRLRQSSAGARVGDTIVRRAEPAAPASTEPPELAPGTFVGDYRIEAKLGEGGMATVYSATHPLIGKKAAVKLMSARLNADPMAVERFVSEARAVNQIGHPNIVDVFTFGKLADGRNYFVMEWLIGETLQSRLEHERMPLRDCLEILLEIIDALEAAHEKGIIHRDLKPDNVFLVAVRGKRVLTKLLDFGIAKLAPTGDISRSKTKTGLFVGTPTHIAPEQARGKNVDHRTDIYALGVIAYQMFCGRLPFEAESAIDIISMHVNQPPPPPRTLWPEIPVELDTLVLGLLEKDAANRPTLVQTAELLTELLGELREQVRQDERVRSGQSGKVRLATPSAPQRVPSQEIATGATQQAPTSSTANAVAPPANAVAPPATLSDAKPLFVAPQKRPGLIAAGVTIAVLGAVLVWSTHKPAPKPIPPPPVVAVAAPPAPIAVPTTTPPPVAAKPSPPAPADIKITVDVPAQIELDGKLVASAARTLTLPLAQMGEHDVVVSAPSRKPYRTKVVAQPGMTAELAVKLERTTMKGGKSAAHSREYMLNPFGGQP